jgi:hypothetical protein
MEVIKKTDFVLTTLNSKQIIMQEPVTIDLSKKPLLKIWYDISYWFQRTFQRQKLYRKVAIHESGHIVFSYFYGFTVRQARLIVTEPGNGFAETVYGKEAAVANIIFNVLIGDFARQKPDTQKHIHKIAVHLMVILYAGSVGEAFVKRKPKDTSYNLEVSGEDLAAIKTIQHFLHNTGLRMSDSDVAKNAFDLYERFPIFKQSIEALTVEFLKSTTLSLTQKQIEDTLTATNFFAIREQIIDANSN